MTETARGTVPEVPPTRRELILRAAVELFGRRGFRGTTVRAIAEQAGVDPALVMHHFGSKEKIFTVVIREAMRTDAFLPEPGDATEAAPGRKLLRAFLVRWEATAAPSPMMVVFRSAMEHPEASRLFSEVASGEFLLPLATRLRAPDPHLQATVLGVLLVGLVTGRYVVRVEPLASLSLDAVVDLFGPHVDRMIGDLITPETESA